MGIARPVSLTALRLVLDAVQSVWPEAELTTPLDGEAAALMLPTSALGVGPGSASPEEVQELRADHVTTTEDLASEPSVRSIDRGRAEVVPPAHVLNLLSAYCHALLESLPEGVLAVRQVVHLPGQPGPFVLAIQPSAEGGGFPAVTWVEGNGWVSETTSAARGDQDRRRLLQRLMGMNHVTRVLSDRTKAQIAAALKAT